MSDRKDTGLAGLLALKAVCCGGLLLALGGVSLGSAISTLAGNGSVLAGGILLAALGLGWWLVRWRRVPNYADGDDRGSDGRGIGRQAPSRIAVE